MFKLTLISSALALVGWAGHAVAQTPPDAGQTLQELRRPLAVPQEHPPLQIEAPGAAGERVPGGQETELRSIIFAGNTVFGADELNAVVADALGKRHDLAGLRTVADRIAAHYRTHGYPFTRAFIAPQALKDGVLRIDVLEGRYDRIQATGSDALAAGAQPFLSRLQPGELIESGSLERSILILEDQPGIKVTPIVRPGSKVGTGDLDVSVERASRVRGELGIDNAGNRFTGEYRAHATLIADSPFLFGDRLAFNGLLTSEDMRLGSLDYELPLGGAGLRGQVGYARTNYALAKEFSYLDASGFAKVWTARGSYPLLRSQQTNLNLSLAYQYKTLEDRFGNVGTVENKSSRSWPLVLRLDHRDALGGGGITYGALTWTSGELSLDSALAAADAATTRKAGHFDKWNLDVARIQKLPGDFSLYGRYSGQWTNKNLDSSERFGLGGAYGVRAYPPGEGLGDKGWLMQAELRFSAGPVTPFAFYDAGKSSVNAQPWDPKSDASRMISGAGIGVRADYRKWNLDLTLAWRNQGGNPTSEPGTHQPRAGLMAAYQF